MERNEYIRIPPKTRGRLPWGYRERKPMRGDRWVAILLAAGAAFWGLLYVVLK